MLLGGVLLPRMAMESFEGLKAIFFWAGRATEGSSCRHIEKKVFRLRTCNGQPDQGTKAYNNLKKGDSSENIY